MLFQKQLRLCSISLSLAAGSIYILIFLCWSVHANADQQRVTPQVDTYVASGKPNDSFSNFNSLFVGYWDSSGRNARRSLLKFDLITQIPVSATITSAVLTLAKRTSSGQDDTFDVRAQRIIGEWDSSVSWDQLSTSLTMSPTLDASPQGQIVRNGSDPKLWEFEITTLLQSWVDDPNPNREQTFGILLAAFDEVPDRYLSFESNDCDQSNCNGIKPVLSYEYSPPVIETTSPSETITPTVTITSTETPTPPAASIGLSSKPKTNLSSGEVVTYTVQLQSGPEDLSGLTITNTVPFPLAALPDTIRSTDPSNWQQTINGNQALWVWSTGNFPANSAATLSVSAQLPSLPPTPEASGLTIELTAPQYIRPRAVYTYGLNITNHTTRTLTNVQITDTIPSDLLIFELDGGETVSSTDSEKVIWPAADQPMLSLLPGNNLTRTLVVFLQNDTVDDVINRDYAATANFTNTTMVSNTVIVTTTMIVSNTEIITDSMGITNTIDITETIFLTDTNIVADTVIVTNTIETVSMAPFVTYVIPSGPLPSTSVTNRTACVSWIEDNKPVTQCSGPAHNPQYDILLPLSSR